ncbi:MAG TPA: MFS transporter [Candidatus Sulfomarinibacteraceae bacterium]|nr:MFS transporter [Candidatus Sulfomarinibacteraceae bacterium]
MRTFLIIWSGQLVSRIGTAMTRFALLIWAYQQTESATTVALLGFFSFLPLIAISPLAGVWIDRVDRRKILLLADGGAMAMTAALLGLYVTGHMEIWHLYVAEGLAGAFEAFQGPAFGAATSTLVPRSQYTRANGLRSLSEFGAQIAGPALGGLLLGPLGIGGVMAMDIVAFLVAAVTLLLVRIPLVRQAGTQAALRQDVLVGTQYIWRRRGLLGFALIMTMVNFLASLTWYSIMPAMVLARSGNNELALASVQSALGLGGVAGAVLVSVWGGPRRKIHGVLLGIAASFMLGDLLLATARVLPLWALAAANGAFFIPLISSCYESIWQMKVPLALQGRVFAARNMMTQALMPAGFLFGGVMADYVFEPALSLGGALAPRLGWLVGVGPGAGMALMFLGSATVAIVMCLAAYLIPAIRNVEANLPDHEFASDVAQVGIG